MTGFIEVAFPFNFPYPLSTIFRFLGSFFKLSSIACDGNVLIVIFTSYMHWYTTRENFMQS